MPSLARPPPQTGRVDGAQLTAGTCARLDHHGRRRVSAGCKPDASGTPAAAGLWRHARRADNPAPGRRLRDCECGAAAVAAAVVAAAAAAAVVVLVQW